MRHVVLNLDHASRCSGPRPCLLASCLGSSRSCFCVCWLHASTRCRRCCCGLLDVLVCLLVCLSVTPCATFSWRPVSCLVAHCSHVYSMLTHVLCVTSLCSARRRPALVISLSTDASVLRVFCFGLGVHPAKAFQAEISAPALLPQPPLRWPCASWSIKHSSTQTCLHLIDWSACWEEPLSPFAARGLGHLLLHLLCLIRATSWMTFTVSVTGCSSSSWLRVQGLIGWRKARSHGKHHASFRMRGRLRSRLQSSSHPSPRGRRRCARPSAGRGSLVLVCHQTSASRVLLCSSRRFQLSWNVKRLSRGSTVGELTLPILAHNQTPCFILPVAPRFGWGCAADG